jgi:hypothetical protein
LRIPKIGRVDVEGRVKKARALERQREGAGRVEVGEPGSGVSGRNIHGEGGPELIHE